MRMVFDDVGPTVHNPVEQIADGPVRNRGAQLLVAVVVAAHGSPVEGHVVRRDRLADAVGFGQRRAQPLLRIDSPHPVLRAEDDRLGAVYRRGGHAHDVGLFGLDHFPIIEIRVGDAEPLLEPLQALLAAIGDGDDFRLLDGLVGAEVAIGLVELAPWRELVLHQPAHAPGADDRHPILCPHSAPPRCCPRSVIAAAGALHRARILVALSALASPGIGPARAARRGGPQGYLLPVVCRRSASVVMRDRTYWWRPSPRLLPVTDDAHGWKALAKRKVRSAGAYHPCGA